MSSLDPQLRPNLAPPQNCPNGCARWDNLAADGNTADQNGTNATWSGGQPPANAGNMCAQPASNGASNSGPWCFCAGTNDSSWGSCQNRDAAAQVCKAVPNKLNSLNAEISSCTSSQEASRISTIGQQTINIQKDVNHLSAVVQDSLMMGDAIYGKASHKLIVEQVKDRNRELKEKKDGLVKDIENKEALVERSDRDFIDTKEALPERFSLKRLNFVEDYTIALNMIGYLFMSIAIIYVYTSTRPEGHVLKGLLMSTTGMVILSMFLYTIFILLA
jgi:hypothetical protein